MAGLKLKNAFSFNKKRDPIEKSSGRVPLITSVSNEFHPRDYEALQPLLMLLNVQSHKCYSYGAPPTDLVVRLGSRGFAPIMRLSLIGTNLRLWLESKSSENEFEDVMNIDVDTLWEHQILERDGNYHIIFEKDENFSIVSSQLSELKQLSGLISLAQFEYGSLFKALTASVISLMGLKIPDIHLILNNNFNFKDWCYININNEWVKAWCHIDKRNKRGEAKGKYKVKFYKDDKSTAKKNMICFISDVNIVEDVFLTTEPGTNTDSTSSGEAWDLEQLKTLMHSGLNSADALDAFLSKINTISVIGSVNWVCLGDSTSDSPRSSRSRSSSLAWAPKSPRARVMSVSETKSNSRSRDNSFSNIAQLSTSKHSRNLSMVSNSSNPVEFDDSQYEAVNQRFLFKPIPHSGVHHLESIIRFLIPLFDCLQLYGRPIAFKSTREDEDSLSFGLPRLPTIDYFSQQELNTLARLTTDDQDPVKRWSFYKLFLRDCYLDPSRNKNQDFRTLSDAWDKPTIDFSFYSKQKYDTLNSSTESNACTPIV